MNTQYSEHFQKAAKAANITPEKLAQKIRDLLAPSKCRNTTRIFDTSLMKAISFAV